LTVESGLSGPFNQGYLDRSIKVISSVQSRSARPFNQGHLDRLIKVISTVPGHQGEAASSLAWLDERDKGREGIFKFDNAESGHAE
jgi:hypothetical protein